MQLRERVMDPGAISYHWVSILLDYIFAFGFSGMVAGFFRKPFYEGKTWSIIVAIIISGVTRFLFSFLSGIFVWYGITDSSGEMIYGDGHTLAPKITTESVVYSITYNAGYILPSIALCILLMCLLAKPIHSLFKTTLIRRMAPDKVQSEHIQIKESHMKMTTFLTIVLSVDAVLLVFALVPFFKMYWLGIVTRVISFASLITSVVLLSRKGTREDVLTDGLDGKYHETSIVSLIAILICSFVLMELSVQAIVSPFTYLKDVYQDAAEEALALI